MIKHISSGTKLNDIGDECPYLPSYCDAKSSIKTLDNRNFLLKKNYNSMVLDKGTHVIYNQKNQAIVDNSILTILNRFDRKEIAHNQKLIEILYRLEFIIDG